MLTVVGREGKYVFVECSVCSQDTELYPKPFKMIKRNFDSGRLPCSCSKSPKYSSKEFDIVVGRIAKKAGYVYLGKVDSSQPNSQAKLRLVCDTHGEWSSCIFNSLRKGVRCPSCANEGKSVRCDATVEEDFLSTGKFPKGTKLSKSDVLDKNGWKPFWNVFCPICSTDQYVIAGLCSGVFLGHRANLIRGWKPCRCSVGYRWSEEQYIYRINNETSYTFVRWAEDFAANSTKTVVYCATHGGEMEMSVSGLLSGNGCLTCFGKRKTDIHIRTAKAKQALLKMQGVTFVSIEDKGNKDCLVTYACNEHGKQSTVYDALVHAGSGCPECRGKRQREAYINFVYDNTEVVAVKFGIANDHALRIKQQNGKNRLSMETYQVYKFDTTRECKKAEAEVKKLLCCGILTKTDLKDGHTETVKPSDLDNVINIFENNGGILWH